MSLKAFNIIFILIQILKINCEVFTSTGHLTALVESTSGVLKSIEQFINDEYARIEKAKT